MTDFGLVVVTDCDTYGTLDVNGLNSDKSKDHKSNFVDMLFFFVTHRAVPD